MSARHPLGPGFTLAAGRRRRATVDPDRLIGLLCALILGACTLLLLVERFAQ